METKIRNLDEFYVSFTIGRGLVVCKKTRNEFVVDMESRSCSCSIPQQMLKPCVHLFLCLKLTNAFTDKNIKVVDLFDKIYRQDMIIQALESIKFIPLNVDTLSESHNLIPLQGLSNSVVKGPGRPKASKRIKSAGE